MHKQLIGEIDFLAVSQTFPQQWPFILSSAGSATTPSARYSMLFRTSGEEIIEHAGPGTAFLTTLASRLETGNGPIDDELPFWGGWFVYLGYEVVTEIENSLVLPRGTDRLPVAYAARTPVAVIYDHWKHQTWLVAETEDALSEAVKELDAVAAQFQSSAHHAGVGGITEMDWVISVEAPEQFTDGVVKILEYIRAGDVFQVNLSRQWVAEAVSDVDPLSVYQALCQTNPAPFAGFARLPGGCVISSSPERLVQRRGELIQTRPIAGTRPRGSDSLEDERLMDELMQNKKERAEHIMLIDLERNDLGRVCQPGSMSVDELMVIESYEHVHHIVSNVCGKLAAHADSVDVIRAVFPGGTITGCPKVRCMEIIAELEGSGRSFYTGAMGYIGHHQTMDFNILIRSVAVDGRSVRFRTGAGIVADSDPQAELLETEAKARGLLNAFGLRGGMHG